MNIEFKVKESVLYIPKYFAIRKKNSREMQFLSTRENKHPQKMSTLKVITRYFTHLLISTTRLKFGQKLSTTTPRMTLACTTTKLIIN